MKTALLILFTYLLFIQCSKSDINDFYENYLGNDTVNLIMLSCFNDKETYPVFQIRHLQFGNNSEIYIDTFKSYIKPKISELRLVINMYADFSLKYVGKVPLLSVDSIKSEKYGPDKTIYRRYFLLTVDKSLLQHPLFKVKHLRSGKMFHTITASASNTKVLLCVNYKDSPENVIASFNNFLTDSVLSKAPYNYNPPY